MDKAPDTQDYTVAYEADFKLKKAIGVKVPLSQIFTPEKIEAGNKIIEDSRRSFFDANLLECESLLALFQDKTNITDAVTTAAKAATSIKGESEIYGFTLVQKTCSHIMAICANEHIGKEKKHALLHDLTQALYFSVKHKITDDGGEAGRALLADIARYRTEKNTDKDEPDT